MCIKISMVLFFLSLFFNIYNQTLTNKPVFTTTTTQIEFVKDSTVYPGIYNFFEDLEQINNKKIGIVTNQTGIIENTHLVDSLLKRKQNIVKIFCPEHGFRGDADAGATINNSIDKKTGLPIISLYGNNKKPSGEQLKGIDIIIFDLQDVGVRFYTYISTLHYVMEACAENKIPLIVLDRPNPNAHYIDGPVLDTTNCRSFIGMHSVPVVYGMSIGEYAKMINGEKWLKNGIICDLTIIPCKNYSHSKKYSLPVRPSPNLPNDRSILLYPTICLFEGTTFSVGRGTDKQFQILGHPEMENIKSADYQFVPQANYGDKNPVFNGKTCFGFDLSENTSYSFDNQINIKFIKIIYDLFPNKNTFFKKTNSFDLLAGNKILRQQIINGISEDEIRKSWQKELENFKKIRQKYLIYD